MKIESASRRAWEGIATDMGRGLRHAGFRPMKQRLMETCGDGECGSATGVEGLAKTHPGRERRVESESSEGTTSATTTFSMTHASGLARSQQVFMAQKFLNLPALPSYVREEGGMVLDRVVANVGTGRWWTTATARVRAQRAWNTEQVQEGKAHRALLDPSMYALGCRFRANAMENVAVKAVGELGSVRGVTRAAQRRLGAARGREGKESEEEELNPRVRVTMQTKIPSHVVSVDLSHNERFKTNESYVDGPTTASVSLASRGRGDLNYRVSARKWMGKNLGSFGVKDGGKKEIQAGASYEKQAVLWRGRRRRKADSSSAVSGYAALPQVPILAVGGVYGTVMRKSLDDEDEEMQLQNFGSLSVHAQVGSFARPLFDYTSINVRVDAGGMGAPNKPLAAETQKPMSLTDRLITMDGRIKSTPSSVTVSVGQQLLGPLRFRTEVRASGAQALSATRAGLSALKERKPMNEVRDSFKKHITSPEIIYGLDCTLPPTIGSARVVGWYNATRQEAFAELRLFDL